MAKCIVCGSTIKSKKRDRYCSKKCLDTKDPRRKVFDKPPTHDISEHNFKSQNTIVKKERKCKKCEKKYVGRNTEQCIDCWRKYTKGPEEGPDLVDLGGFITHSEP